MRLGTRPCGAHGKEGHTRGTRKNYRKFVRTLSDEELAKAGKRPRILCGDVVTPKPSTFNRQLKSAARNIDGDIRNDSLAVNTTRTAASLYLSVPWNGTPFTGHGSERQTTSVNCPGDTGKNPTVTGSGTADEKPVMLKQVGCEARKNPAVGGVFFLDFSLLRTY